MYYDCIIKLFDKNRYLCYV